jgi:hypothetical protein
MAEVASNDCFTFSCRRRRCGCFRQSKILVLRGALPLEIDDVSRKQAGDVVGSLQQISVRREREEVRVSKNRKLGFEPEQLSFGSAIKLALLGSRIAAISVGDVAGDREGSDDERIGGGLGLAPGAMTDEAEYFAAQGNCLLPDFEIPQASCHGHTMPALLVDTGTGSLPIGANARSLRSWSSAACENPCL